MKNYVKVMKNKREGLQGRERRDVGGGEKSKKLFSLIVRKITTDIQVCHSFLGLSLISGLLYNRQCIVLRVLSRLYTTSLFSSLYNKKMINFQIVQLNVERKDMAMLDFMVHVFSLLSSLFSLLSSLFSLLSFSQE